MWRCRCGSDVFPLLPQRPTSSPPGHRLAGVDFHASLHEMRKEDEFPAAQVHDDVIAGRIARIRRADCLVGQSIDNGHHRPDGRCKYRLTPAEVAPEVQGIA